MKYSNRSCGRMLWAMALGGAWVVAGAVARADDPIPAPNPTIDRRLGEEEQLRKRHEWFYSTRQAGTTRAEDRARLRLDGVTYTQQALDVQRRARLEGRALTQNPWAPKGPEASAFGGWAFGKVSGRVTSLASDWSGGVLYLGTAAGGLWKSLDDGQSWTQLFDAVGTMTVGAVAVDPNNPSVIWAGTGDSAVGCESYFGIGLLRSADGGATWEARNGSGASSLQDLAMFADVLVDPRDSNHLVVGGRIRQCADGSGFEGGIYVSGDAGVSWTSVLSGKQVYEIAQDPSVMDIFWAATDDGVYKSVNNGVSWAQQTGSGLPNSGVGRTEIAVAPSASNTVYALFANGPQLWRTTDGGATWSQMVFGGNACDGQCWYNMALRVHRTNPDIVYRGTIRGFRSTNGGASWTDLTGGWGSGQKVHQDMHVLLMHPTNTNKWYIGSDGGLWKTENDGTSFTNLNTDLNTFLFYAVGVAADDPEMICGGAQDNSSVVRTTSNVWNLQAVTGDGFVCQFNPQNINYSYITSYPSGGYPSVWRSTNGPFGGWGSVTGSGSGVISGDRSNWVTPYQLDPLSPNVLYLGTHRIYRSDNHGSSWTQMGPDLTGGSGSLLAIDVNRNFPNFVYTGSESGRVWRSTDGAATWTDLTSGLPGRSINDITSDPGDPDRAFAVVGGFNTAHVWEWTLAGGWAPRVTGLPNVPHNTILMLSASDILVGNDVGVYRSFDGGQSFTPWMDGLPLGLVVTDLRYNVLQNIVTAGTYGRGAWQTALGDVSPILLYESAMPPVEVDGNGDGIAEPGETWGVQLRLRNGGGATANDAQATVATAATGVTMLESRVMFGDILPSVVAGAQNLATFTLDPSMPCGQTLSFDVVDLTTTNDPGPFADAADAISLTVGGFLPPVTLTWLDDDFDPAPVPEWSHAAVHPNLAPCVGQPYIDEWKIRSKDAAHGDSYHCGKGEGLSYSKLNFSWLYHGGRDSQNGPGITLPGDALSATLTIDHWYSTAAGSDGGVVLIDFLDDGIDNYLLLSPVGGYPGGALPGGVCNGLQGLGAFQGASGGWITSTFDLTAYAGSRVYLAFVFGSDNQPSGGEGWYIDNIRVESEANGAPVCEILDWPGSVPDDVRFDRNGTGTLEAVWSEACNTGSLPGQQYSIHVGDLDLLHDAGTFDHAPLSGMCSMTSPATFAYGSGNEYYLVIANDAGVREGGAGTDSSGEPRPTTGSICGEPRPGACP